MLAFRCDRAAGVILAMEFALSGCSLINWTRVTLNQPLQQQDVAFIRPGVTTWDEVVERLGAPSELKGTPTGMRATYDYYDGKRFHVDFGSVAGLFLPPGASEAPHQLEFSNGGVGADTFQVTFDSNGTVQYEGFSRSAAASQFKPSPFQSRSP
jgi:outer membrane protein assembly factor BamE (lipoprotein component of BamABCDE complex)